jgi:hypothetical protein
VGRELPGKTPDNLALHVRRGLARLSMPNRDAFLQRGLKSLRLQSVSIA